METTGAIERARRPASLAALNRRPALLALIVALVGSGTPHWVAPPALAQVAEPWPGLQGGPAHQGEAPAPVPQPPLRVAWRTEAEGEAGLSAPALARDVGVAVGRDRVIGFDPESGEVAWSVDRRRGPIVPPAVSTGARMGQNGAGASDVAVFVEGEGPDDSAVVAISLGTRERLWRQRLGDESNSSPVIEGDQVFVGSRGADLLSLDLASGEVRWRVKTDGAVDASPAVAGPMVFAVAENGRTGAATLHALHRQTGRSAWAYSPSGVSAGVTSPTVVDETVYVGFGDRSFRALKADDGSVVWSTRVRTGFSPLTAPASSGPSVFVADGGGSLYRVERRTGSLVWDFQLPGFVVRGSPLVVGETVYQGLDEGLVAAIRVETGRLVWRTGVRGGLLGALAPAGERILVPAAGAGGGIVALERDPSGRLVDVPSPSELRVREAVLNYAAAFVLMLGGVLALSRYGLRRRATVPGSSREHEVRS